MKTAFSCDTRLTEPRHTVSAAPSVDAAVKAEDLGRRFGNRWVFRDLSLDVRFGEVVALLGSNGSGKTTLLRVLAGCLGATEGSVRIGQPSTANGRGLHVGLMSGDAYLYDELTATENLKFAMRMLGAPCSREACTHALIRVGIDPGLTRPLRAYSSGMRRRVALARALIGEPRLLLLDEPYASLDEQGTRVVDCIVRTYAAAGGAVLIATHQVERAREVCNRFLALRVKPVTGLTKTWPLRGALR